MKLFVSKGNRPLGWARVENGASVGPRRGSEGRFRRLGDLYEWMLTFTGILLVANFLSLLHLPALLEYLFGGVLLGGTIGRFVVGWHERGGHELPPLQVRRIERLWVAAGIALAALAVLVQAALVLA